MLILSFFTEYGTPKSALSPTIDIVDIATDVLVVNGGAMTSLTNMSNAYYYNFGAFSDKNKYAITVDGGAILNDIDRYQYAALDSKWDEVIEGSLTGKNLMRIFLSALTGKSTGGGTATFTTRDLANSKARITMTVDVNENRINVILDGD